MEILLEKINDKQWVVNGKYRLVEVSENSWRITSVMGKCMSFHEALTHIYDLESSQSRVDYEKSILGIGDRDENSK